MNVQEKLQEYYRHDGRKLKNLVDKILTTYGGISQKDYDDFYSVANETVAKAIPAMMPLEIRYIHLFLHSQQNQNRNDTPQ